MLTTKERRFIKYWEEQRKGGKWSYFTLYILAGTFIGTLVIMFLLSVTSFEFPDKIWKIPLASFILITLITIATWILNEKKFKKIIKRVVRDGKLMDDKLSDDKMV